MSCFTFEVRSRWNHPLACKYDSPLATSKASDILRDHGRSRSFFSITCSRFPPSTYYKITFQLIKMVLYWEENRRFWSKIVITLNKSLKFKVSYKPYDILPTPLRGAILWTNELFRYYLPRLKNVIVLREHKQPPICKENKMLFISRVLLSVFMRH